MRTFAAGCGLVFVGLWTAWDAFSAVSDVHPKRDAAIVETTNLRDVIERSKAVLALEYGMAAAMDSPTDWKNAPGIEVLRLAETNGGVEVRLRGSAEKILSNLGREVVSIRLNAEKGEGVVEAVVVQAKGAEAPSAAPRTVAEQREYLARAEKLLIANTPTPVRGQDEALGLAGLGETTVPAPVGNGIESALVRATDELPMASAPPAIEGEIWAEPSGAEESSQELSGYRYLGIVRKGRGEAAGVFRDEVGRKIVTARPGEMLGEWRVITVSSESAMVDGLAGKRWVGRRH